MRCMQSSISNKRGFKTMDVPPMQKLLPRQRGSETMKQYQMKPMKHVKNCDTCRGTGQVWGAVQHIYCPSCLGVRYQAIGPVDQSASTQDLGDELHEARIALAVAIDHLNSIPLSTGGESSRYVSNTRGPGGSNFTGD